MSVICMPLIKFLDIPPRAMPIASRDAGRAVSDAVIGKQSRITSPCRPGGAAHHHTTPHPTRQRKRHQHGIERHCLLARQCLEDRLNCLVDRVGRIRKTDNAFDLVLEAPAWQRTCWEALHPLEARDLGS